MRFRLVLRGHLPPEKRGQGDVKQRIRRELHPQLRRLWEQHPMLKNAWTGGFGGKTSMDMVADEFSRCGFRFVPLVRTVSEMACSLDFLILRREEPNRLFSGSGDLDSRVKTLIDGLRMPQQCSEVDGHIPRDDENPFFCLLEDDKLIFNFSVTTDRLLVPPEPQEPERDIVAVIGVEVRTTDGGEITNFRQGWFYPR